jgi:4-carboxymuconolactone decarboxylase
MWRPRVDEGARALVVLSAAVASGDRAAQAAAMDEAARHCAGVAVEEALLQSYLFLGYPRALRALKLWRERSGPGAVAEAAPLDPAAWRRRGEAVCQRVYGGQYPRLRANIAALHPDLEAWMLAEGYGKVLGRAGLDLAVRELCIVAVLVWQDAPEQLYSHLRGALNVGVAEAEVEAVLGVACAALPPERREAAERVWGVVQARWRAAGDR